MKRDFLFLIFFGLFGISANYRQNDRYGQRQIDKIVQVSPNAVSPELFGGIPAGYHTGVPNVSIPVYEIPKVDVTLPVTPSYHTSIQINYAL